jgi:hypothetical protein
VLQLLPAPLNRDDARLKTALHCCIENRHTQAAVRLVEAGIPYDASEAVSVHCCCILPLLPAQSPHPYHPHPPPALSLPRSPVTLLLLTMMQPSLLCCSPRAQHALRPRMRWGRPPFSSHVWWAQQRWHSCCCRRALLCLPPLRTSFTLPPGSTPRSTACMLC